MRATAQETRIKLTLDNETVLTATLVENSSVEALVELLDKGPITIEMSDYGNMEKVGEIGTSLPRNDEQITTEPGDIILYHGSALVIYYAPNSWNFTRLGKIDNITPEDLLNVLGEGEVTVTLELADLGTDIDHIDGDENIYRAYFNPVQNIIEASGDIKSMTLIDAKGRTMLKSKGNFIDVNDIASGIYFLKIGSENTYAVINKIIKTN